MGLWVKSVHMDFPVVNRLEYTDWPDFGLMPKPGFKGLLEREIVSKMANCPTVQGQGKEWGRMQKGKWKTCNSLSLTIS